MDKECNPTSMPLSISPNEREARDVKLIIGNYIIQPGFTDMMIVNSIQEFGVKNSEMIGWKRLYELGCIGGVDGIEGEIRVRGVKNGV